MMRKIFVSATVAAALCSLAISATPALGLEFESEGTYSKTSSTTEQTIQLGTSGWLECAKMEMKTTDLTVGALTELEVQLEKYTTCSYHNKLEVESVSGTTACITLESADLEEQVEEKFDKGRLTFGCTLKFKNVSGTGCQVEIFPARAALPEYEWINLDGTPKHYESLIHFKIETLEYAVKKIGSAACKGAGATGSDAEYDGSIPISYVTIFPEF
jgi:hypothetical protein